MKYVSIHCIEYPADFYTLSGKSGIRRILKKAIRCMPRKFCHKDVKDDEHHACTNHLVNTSKIYCKTLSPL